MKGSERQVEWAIEIRDELLIQLDKAQRKAGDAPTPEGYTSTWDEIERAISKCDDARALIDNRGWFLNFARSNDEDTIDAQVAELTADMPTLRGTEKQVEWAERLRGNLIREMVAAPYHGVRWKFVRWPKSLDFYEYVKDISRIDIAHWFIEYAKDGADDRLYGPEPMPYLSPEQEALVAPLFGSANAVLVAEAERARLINMLLSVEDHNDREAQWLEQARSCNSAAEFKPRDFGGLPRSVRGIRERKPNLMPCTPVRIPVERNENRFTLAEGPFAGLRLDVDFDRLIEEGDGWIEYAAAESLWLTERGKSGAWVPVAEVLDADAETKLVPPRWNERRDWQTVYIPAVDVERYGPGKSKVTLRRSEAEGLYLILSDGHIDTTRLDGTLALSFHKDRSYTLYGAAEKKTVSARWLFDDRTNPSGEPGESLAVEWLEVSMHPSHMHTLRNGRAVVVDFPDDHDEYPGWSFFHPAKLSSDGKLRAHAEWLWRISRDDESVELTTAEFAELVKPWASTKRETGAVTTVGKTTTTKPVCLEELERVAVLDDLCDDL